MTERRVYIWIYVTVWGEIFIKVRKRESERVCVCVCVREREGST